MSFLPRIFRGNDRREALDPLYRAVVDAARDPGWYRDGGVPDTLDGRFDMVAAVLALILLRLEREGESSREASVLLTELFIGDMEASLRQIGIGDYVVGKHIGRMMSALGGRLAAFRSAVEEESGFADPVRRNIFHESPPSDEAIAVVAERLERFGRRLKQYSVEILLQGRLPTP